MKLSVAILAILATVVVVDGAPLCDPSKLSVKFYYDGKCGELNKVETERNGKISPE